MSITHIRKPIPVTSSSLPIPLATDWLDPHPFRDVLPWAIVAGVCLGLGLVLAKLTWARFRWLRLPSRLLWLTGLGSLLYTTILVAPRQLALILLVSIFTVAVPLLLILATMYVFRTPPSVTSTTRPSTRITRDSEDSGKKEDSVPLMKDVEKGLD